MGNYLRGTALGPRQRLQRETGSGKDRSCGGDFKKGPGSPERLVWTVDMLRAHEPAAKAVR